MAPPQGFATTSGMHMMTQSGFGRSRTAAFVAAILCCWRLPIPVTAIADSEPLNAIERQEAIEQLTAGWEARRSEIATAEIRYRQVRFSIEEPTLTPEQVREIVERINVGEHPEQLRELTRELKRSPWTIEPPWAVSRMVYDGLRTRYEQGVHRQVRSAELDMIYDGDNEQVSVFPRGKSGRRYAYLKEFRWVPTDRMDLDLFEMSRPAPNRIGIHLRTGADRGLLDAESGLRLHMQSFHPESTEPSMEYWEQGTVQYPGGVLFPSGSVEAQYREGLLSSFWIRLIDEANFNIDLSEAEFQLACQEGDVVLDYRSGEKSVYRLPASTTDLERDLAPPPPPALPAPLTTEAERPVASTYRWFIGINGVLLILVALFLWRRSQAEYNAEMQNIVKDTHVE